jgi:hypothetical protein
MKIETVRPPLLLALALLIATAGSFPTEHVEAEEPVAAPAWDEEEFALYSDVTLELCEHRTGFVLTVNVACPRRVDNGELVRNLAGQRPD